MCDSRFHDGFCPMLEESSSLDASLFSFPQRDGQFGRSRSASGALKLSSAGVKKRPERREKCAAPIGPTDWLRPSAEKVEKWKFSRQSTQKAIINYSLAGESSDIIAQLPAELIAFV